MSTFDPPERRRGSRGMYAVAGVAVVLAALVIWWAVGQSTTGSDPGLVFATSSDDPDPTGSPSAPPSPTAVARAATPSEPTPPPTPTAEPEPTPVPEHPVRIATRPKGAAVTIVAADGTTEQLPGTTPLTATLPEGEVTLALDREGRQPLTRTITVDGEQRHRWQLDPPGQLHHHVVNFETGSAPKQVAFTPDSSELWVTLLGGPGVAVHDPLTGERLATIDLLDHGAVEVIFTADGSTAYVSQMETASVFEIDTATREVTRQLPTDGTWTKVLALSPDEQLLYASNWVSNDVSEIDLDTGEVVRVIPTVTTPRGLYVSPDGAQLYVAGFDDGDLQRVDLATGDTDLLESTGGAMRHLVGDPDKGLVYAGDMAVDALYVHELGTDEVRHLADTDVNPNTIDLSPDGRVIYVSNRGLNNPETYYIPGPEWGTVLAIDTATGEPLDAIVGGNQSTGLDVSEDGRLLAFSDFLDNQVQVYEIPPHDVLADGDGGRYEAHLDELVK